ncbi:MAG: extracellular solute-binding protein [Anaerolineae bacterium]|nr:extracellular solute-binding protein [Anaerolineae bacterium]
MKVTRRDFLRYSSLAVLSGALAACAPATPAPAKKEEKKPAAEKTAAPEEKVEISYLVRSDIQAKIQKWTELTVKEFQELHPNITVKVIGVPWGDYNAKLLAMFAAGQPPEVAANYAAGFPTFYSNQAIVPLDDYIASEQVDLSVFEPKAIEAVTRKGKLWALPLAHMPTIVFYNKDHFDEAGVEPPPIDWADKSWTLDALLEKATALAHDVEDPRKVVWGVYFWYMQLGTASWLWDVDPFNNKGGPQYTEAYKTGLVTEVYYNAPKMVEAMQWIADLTYKHKVNPRPTDMDAMQQASGWPMMTGKLAMTVDGGWHFSEFVDVQPSWKWGAAPLPYGPTGVNTTPLYNDSWMLCAKAKHPKEGFQLLEYLTLGNGAKLYAEMTGFFPANKTFYDIWFDSVSKVPSLALTRDELVQVVSNSFKYGFATPGKTLDRYPELNSAFSQTTAPIWNGEVSVPEGMDVVQKKFESLIATWT